MKSRLVLTSVAVCLLGLLVLLVPTALTLRSLYHHADVLELQRELGIVVQQLPGTPGEAAALRPVTSDLHHRYAQYDRFGRRVAGDGPDVADPVVRAALAGGTGEGVVGTDVVAALPVFGGTQVTGAVRASEPTREGSRRVTVALLQLSLLAVVALGVAALTGLALFRRLLRPLDQLRHSAARLGDGDFTAQVPPTGMAELDDVGAALNGSNHRLARLIERERQFSADASHQLRTPVAAMRTAFETELLAPRSDAREVLREGLRELDRLESTVQDLLRLARDSPVDRGPLQVGPLLVGAAQRWQGAAAAHGRVVQVCSAADLPVVHASATAIGHVLDVLLANALMHGRGTVTLRADGLPHGVALSVRDDRRIDPVAEQELFRRRGAGQGHGIGLALARTLVEAEGGRLRLSCSEPTTFDIVLTAGNGAAPPQRESTAAGPVTGRLPPPDGR